MVDQAPKSGFQQYLCPQGELQLSPAFPGDLQDQEVCLTQDPFKLLLLPWVWDLVGFCVSSLRVESPFPTGP